MLQYGHAVAVVKAHVVELDAAVNGGRKGPAGLRLLRRAQNVLKARQRHVGLAQVCQHAAKLAHGESEHGGVGGKQHHLPKCQLAVYGKPHAAAQAEGYLQIAQRVGGAPEHAHQRVQVRDGAPEGFVLLGKHGKLRALGRKGAHHAHAGEVFLYHGGKLALGLVRFQKLGLYAAEIHKAARNE